MKWWWFILGVVLSCLPVQMASGAELFHDSFTSTSYVDTNQTSAEINTSQGWVELPSASQANVIAALSDDGDLPSDIVVTQASGMQWYSYDQASNKYVNVAPLNAAYSNPLGVALVGESKTAYVFGLNQDGSHYVRQVVRDPSGAIENPVMSVTNLQKLVSITAIDDQTFGDIDQSGFVSVYTYDTVSHQPVLDLTHSFATGLTSVKSITHIPNTWNFVVTTKTGSYQFVFDQLTSNYQKNIAKTVETESEVVAGAVNSTGDLVALLTPSQSSVYTSMFDQQTGAMSQASIFQMGGDLSNTTAVSLPSDTSTVIASKDGVINTYRLDSLTGKMVLDSALQISGLSFVKNYSSPGLYQSIPIPIGKTNMFQVVASENNDPGTSISYAISADGGSSFTSVTPTQWIHLPAGTTNPPIGSNVVFGPLVIKSMMSSSDSYSTPRLTNLVVHGYLDVTPPTTPGKPSVTLQNSNQLTVEWSSCIDPVLPPSTGASGLDHYLLRYSADGMTWTDWTSTGATNNFSLTEPDNYEATMKFEVKAVDSAGNISTASPMGSYYVNTKPLRSDGLQINQIVAPSDGQLFPTTQVPVYVKAGGEVIFSVTTTGAAQSIHVQYSDGKEQDLIPLHSPSDEQDTNTFVGYYYPSSTQLIPLTTPDGTVVSINCLTVHAPGKTDFAMTSALLVVNGTLGNGVANFLPPRVTR